MEITSRQAGEVLEMHLNGRLDAYWADHLSNAVTAAVREGARNIELNMARVNYISSAGIRVLLNVYSMLKDIHGSLGVREASEQVNTVLQLTGLTGVLSQAQSSVVTAPAATIREIERDGIRMQLYEQAPGESLRCAAFGRPELLAGCNFTAADSKTASFPASVFAMGLGAFGHDFEDCRNRFGEFLAVSGAVAYLPTDGTNVPDYLVASGNYAPEMQVLYCLQADGKFRYHARFQFDNEKGRISLSNLVRVCLELSESETAGVVIVAETAGLVGAALTQSPATQAGANAPFGLPEAREWVSFTSERAFARSLSLIAGVVSQNPDSRLSAFVRPIATGSELQAHLHAAPFSYRPLKSGELNLKETVARLFEAETVQGILHLINDDRKIGGAGESELIRGACWIGPITNHRGTEDSEPLR